MLKKKLLLACLIVGLSGCAKDAHLYPVNDIATPGGVLTAHYTSYGTGHGEVEITMPDGENLKGEYSLVRGGAIGFGSIYGAVYGAGGSASVSGTSLSYAMPGGSPGVVSLFGDKGTSMQCEVYNDNLSGHGFGGCKSSTGALYRIQY